MAQNTLMLLDERYVVQIMIDLLAADKKVKISEFLYLMKSFPGLNSLTDRMAQEGLIRKFLDRETFVATFLELTPKGRAVAEKLKEAVDIFQDQCMSVEEKNFEKK